MRVKRGLARFAVLAIWGFACAEFSLYVFNEMKPLGYTYTAIEFCVSLFIYGFYFLPTVFIMLADWARPEAERRYDPWDFPLNVVYAAGAIIGFVSLLIFAQVYTPPRVVHMGHYVVAFMLPFMFVLGNYVLISWVVEGFRDIIE